MVIYIPTKIRVGYQKREGTYTGKLAYVTYFGPKGELRKEKSWSDWCSGYARNKPKNIPHDDYDNEPTSGFVLNKKAGGYSSGWNHRQTYARIYDPRGFEFEITVDNLLYILENVDCTRGKGLEGNFVYGWDRGDLILIPEAASEYKNHLEWSETVKQSGHIKGKDLILGAKYLTNKNLEAVYLGRFDYHDQVYRQNGYVTANKGKHYFFVVPSEKWDRYIITKSVSKRIVKALTDKADPEYATLMEELEHEQSYSPYDPSKDKYVKALVKDLKNHRTLYFTLGGIEVSDSISWSSEGNVYLHGRPKRVKPIALVRDIWGSSKDIELDEAVRSEPNLFPRWGSGAGMDPEEFIEKFKPTYKRRFQENGKEIKR